MTRRNYIHPRWCEAHQSWYDGNESCADCSRRLQDEFFAQIRRRSGLTDEEHQARAKTNVQEWEAKRAARLETLERRERHPSADSGRAEEIRRGDNYHDPNVIWLGARGEYE